MGFVKRLPPPRAGTPAVPTTPEKIRPTPSAKSRSTTAPAVRTTPSATRRTSAKSRITPAKSRPETKEEDIMAKTLYEDRKLIKTYDLHPFEDLCVVGLDTKHKSRTDHFYWDPRVLLAVDPLKIENADQCGIVQTVLYKRVDVSSDERFGKWCAKGKVALVTEGRQRVRWARGATLLRQERGDEHDVVFVNSREMTGTELQNWIRSRAANVVREASDPISLAYEMLELRGMGLADETIASTYALKIPDIQDQMRLLDLSPKSQDLIRTKRLSETGAKLLREMTHVEQDAELDKMLEAGTKLTVENVRAVQRTSKVRAAGKGKARPAGDDEDLVGVKLTLKQIHKLAVVVGKGEIETEPFLGKILNVLCGKTAGKGIKGMTKVLREIGVEVE